MPARTTSIRRAFTIIELMVTVSVITVLLALMAPQLAKAKLTAHMAQCGNNLHNNGVAIRLYGYNHKEAYPDFFYSFTPGNNQANTVVILYKPKKAASTGWTYLDPSCMVCPDDDAPGMVHVLDPVTGAISDYPDSYDVNVDFLIREHTQDLTNAPAALALMFDGAAGYGGKQGAYLGTDSWAPGAFQPRHMYGKYGGVLWADGHATMEESLSTSDFIMQGDQPWVHGNGGGNGGGKP